MIRIHEAHCEQLLDRRWCCTATFSFDGGERYRSMAYGDTAQEAHRNATAWMGIQSPVTPTRSHILMPLIVLIVLVLFLILIAERIGL